MPGVSPANQKATSPERTSQSGASWSFAFAKQTIRITIVYLDNSITISYHSLSQNHVSPPREIPNHPTSKLHRLTLRTGKFIWRRHVHNSLQGPRVFVSIHLRRRPPLPHPTHLRPSPPVHL